MVFNASDPNNAANVSTPNVTRSNYQYDPEGRLVRDDQEGIAVIKWRVVKEECQFFIGADIFFG